MKLFLKNKRKPLKKSSNNLTLNQQKELLFKSIEKIGLVAIRKLENGQEQAFNEVLDDLENIFTTFLKLQESNPGKFRAFLADSDRLPLIQNINIDDDIDISAIFDNDNKTTNTYKPDPIDVPHDMEQLYLSYSGIQIFTNVLFRIWDKANDLKFLDLAANVLLKINSIIEILVSNYSNLNLNIVGYFLDTQTRIIRNGLYSFDNRHLYLIHSYYIWFLDIVFHKDFDIRYISEFSRKLFTNNQIIIDNNNSSLFEHFVSSVVDRHLLDSLGNENYSLINSINFRDQLREGLYSFDNKIRGKAMYCYSLSELHSLINEIIEFKESKIRRFPDKIEKYCFALEAHAISYFKYNNLRKIFIWIGSYCLFKKRYRLLEYQLYYNSPKDTSASWVNKDINPEGVGEVINILTQKYSIEREVVFGWGGHSDFMGYFNQYIFVLITHICSQATRSGKDLSKENHKGLFGNRSKDQLNQIKYELELQKKIAEGALEKEKDYIKEIGYSSDLIKNIVLKLLDQLILDCSAKYEAIESYSKLSIAKVETFKKSVVNLFHQKVINRNIIKHYSQISNELIPWEEGQKAFGLNEVYPKEFFIEDTSSMHDGWTGGFPDRLAFQNDMFINREWIKNSVINKKIEAKEVVEIINKHFERDIDNELIIIGTNMRFSFQVFGNEKEYLPSWKKNNKEDWWDQTRLIGFYKDHEVFMGNDQTRRESFLILNKNHLGKIQQRWPFKDVEKEEMTDIFYFTLDAYSENQEMLDELIAKEPPWLKEKGDEAVQKAFLLKQVRIKIFESFTVEFDDEFEGYSYWL
jgi:hypothetical protein